jgi:ABC-type branched-subunit amino acid transport system permease subunit
VILFLQFVINGLIIGGAYALIGIGLTLIFGIMNVVNFAHGEMYMLGAYFLFTFFSMLGIDFYVSMMFAIAAVLFPLFVQDTYVMHMAILIGIYTLGAISVNLLLGYAGQLSLGHAAFFGMGAYVSALICLKLALPMWIGMVVAALFAGLLGYVVAKLALKLRGAYFVILTIGVAEILKLVGLNWGTLTKGPMGLTDIPAAILRLAPILVDQVEDIIMTLKKKGMTLLLVEQNANMALRLADYAYVMETGQIVLEGSAAAMTQDDRVVKAYLGGR